MKCTNRLRSGSNCRVYKFSLSGGGFGVFKEYGIFDEPLTAAIFREHVVIRELLHKTGISIPTLYGYSSGSGGSLLEEFIGPSIRDLILDKTLHPEELDSVMRASRNFIGQLSEDIPLDTNPGNISVKENGDFYFIDFMPPNPWLFLKNKALRGKYEKYFPNTANVWQDDGLRKRYYEKEYRIEKFDYYSRIYLNRVGGNYTSSNTKAFVLPGSFHCLP
jgi:hypothetical protein